MGADNETPCVVTAGEEVSWDGRLTPAQCEAFPVKGPPLGRGTFATAYQHRDDPTKVVKFTADKADATASSVIAKKKLASTVRVFEVAKLKGQQATAPVLGTDSSGALKFETKKNQPVYAMITEKLRPIDEQQEAAVRAFNDIYRVTKPVPGSVRPMDFRVKDYVDLGDASLSCVAATGNAESCGFDLNEIVAAVDEQARWGGMIPLDLHPGNWGVKKVRGSSRLAILDLGLSAVSGKVPRIRQLAGRKKNMSKRSRVRKPTTYDYTLGALGADGTPAASFASSLLPRALAIGGLGALAYWFLFSSKAAARENAKNAAIPTGSATGASVTAEAGAPVPTFIDPGSNTTVAGPSGTVMVSNGTYIVKRGESWSNIASRVYGDYRWWPALWDANRKLGRFGNPSTLAVGDVIVVPRLPVASERLKKLVFARAEVDRAWELKKLKKGAKAAGPRPKETFTATEVTAVDIAADAKAAAAADVIAVVKEPVALPAPAPTKEVDYVTSGEMSAEPEGGVEDLSS